MPVSKRRRVVLAAGIVAVAALAVYWFVTSGRGSAAAVIAVSGNIEVTSADLSFKIAGRVAERLIDEGQPVQAGQVVARLDDAELAQTVALNRAQLAAAEANLAQLEAGSRPEEIASAEAAVERSRSDLALAEANWTRQRQLYQSGVSARNEYDAAAAAYKAAQAALADTRARLNLTLAGPRKEAIDAARANVEQARQALAVAETRLGYATLVSPLTGVVISKNVEAGEYVAAGTPVITVADLVNVWLRAYIDETDLGRVQLGRPARVRTDTFPGKVYEGTVSFISSEAEFTPRAVETRKERVRLVYRVKIDIRNTDMELKAGMPADAEIITDAGPGRQRR